MNRSSEIQRLSAAVSALASTIAEIITERLREAASDREQMVKTSPPGLDQAVAQNSRTPFLTKRQAAAQLQVSLRTLDNWTSRGLLPYIKLGRLVRFSITDIENTLNRRHRIDRR